MCCIIFTRNWKRVDARSTYSHHQIRNKVSLLFWKEGKLFPTLHTERGGRVTEGGRESCCMEGERSYLCSSWVSEFPHVCRLKFISKRRRRVEGRIWAQPAQVQVEAGMMAWRVACKPCLIFGEKGSESGCALPLSGFVQKGESRGSQGTLPLIATYNIVTN